MSDIGDKLKKLSVGKSTWIYDARYRQKNSKWLNYSQMIALSILQALDDQNISKEEFSEKLNIPIEKCNNIVKGWENLDIKMISEIETVLDIELLKL